MPGTHCPGRLNIYWEVEDGREKKNEMESVFAQSISGRAAAAETRKVGSWVPTALWRWNNNLHISARGY